MHSSQVLPKSMFIVKVVLKLTEDKNVTALGNDILPAHKADFLDNNKKKSLIIFLYTGKAPKLLIHGQQEGEDDITLLCC